MANINTFKVLRNTGWTLVETIIGESLMEDTKYSIENRGTTILLFCTKDNEPEEGEGVVLEHLQNAIYTHEGNNLWVKNLSPTIDGLFNILY